MSKHEFNLVVRVFAVVHKRTRNGRILHERVTPNAFVLRAAGQEDIVFSKRGARRRRAQFLTTRECERGAAYVSWGRGQERWSRCAKSDNRSLWLAVEGGPCRIGIEIEGLERTADVSPVVRSRSVEVESMIDSAEIMSESGQAKQRGVVGQRV